MKIKNNKGFTLIELVVYVGIFAIASVFTVAIFSSFLAQNNKTNMLMEESMNINNSYIYLKKVLENIDNVLILSHNKINSKIENDNSSSTIDNQYFNQHQFSINEFQTKCGFITNSDYDFIAFSSKDSLDPIAIGVIEGKTENGRKYHQLAIYKYYSIFTEKSKILNDLLSGNISNFVDNRGLYKTEGLTDYKCNKNNGFLIPIGSKFYFDNYYDFDYTSFLRRLKILSTDISDNVKYGNGLVKFLLEWESIEKTNSNLKYQYFSKEL